MRVEAKVHVREGENAAYHQAGADQQHNRKPHFRNDQRGAELAMAETSLDAEAGILEPRVQILARGVESGR